MENESESDLEPENLNLPDKVLKYETFINEVLRRDLKIVLDERDKIYSQLAEYLQLRNTIQQIQEYKLSELKTRVDLGCNFYCQAVVPDTSTICVSVGLGFFIEFTQSEALKFIEKKSKFLTEKSDVLTADACRIKAHIKLVLEGLRELQEIPPSNEERGRTDVWA